MNPYESPRLPARRIDSRRIVVAVGLVMFYFASLLVCSYVSYLHGMDDRAHYLDSLHEVLNANPDFKREFRRALDSHN